MKTWLWGLAMLIGLLLAGCGRDETIAGDSSKIHESDIVVRSRAEIELNMGGGKLFHRSATKSTDQTISVINSKLTSMTLSNAEFAIPTVDSELEDFGFLEITDLRDNDLKVCGANGLTKCGTALIRLYTTGTAQAGFYNASEGYGVPLLAGMSSLSTIGLESASATVMATFSIPATKRVVRLSDFAGTPKFNVKGDFTEAGPGSFSTKLVIEYALAP